MTVRAFSPKPRRPRRRTSKTFGQRSWWDLSHRSSPEYQMHLLAGMGIVISIMQAFIFGLEAVIPLSEGFLPFTGAVLCLAKGLYYWQRPSRIRPFYQAFSSVAGLVSVFTFLVFEGLLCFGIARLLPSVAGPMNVLLAVLGVLTIYVLLRGFKKAFEVYRHHQEQVRYFRELDEKHKRDVLENPGDGKVNVHLALERYAHERAMTEQISGEYELVPMEGRSLGKMPKGIKPLPPSPWQAIAEDLSEIARNLPRMIRRRSVNGSCEAGSSR